MKSLSRSSLFGVSLLILIIILLLIAIVMTIIAPVENRDFSKKSGLDKFTSDAELVELFRNASSSSYNGFYQLDSVPPGSTAIPFPMPTALPAPVRTGQTWGGTLFGEGYSETNVQVKGVDEADMIKTDGDYIYLVGNNNLSIIKAYPAVDAHMVSSMKFDNFTPQELFINDDRLLVFGSSYIGSYKQMPATWPGGLPYWRGLSMATAMLYDISDRSNPRLVKTFDIEGNYLTARMIGDYAYFVVNTYPSVYLFDDVTAKDIIPVIREDSGDFRLVANATDIYFIPQMMSPSFVTICSVSIGSGEMTSETITGSGRDVYVSQDNLYFTRYDNPYNYYYSGSGENETTTVVKLHLDRGSIMDARTGKVPGYLLNQFSMDEYDGYFRIATTKGNLFDINNPSTSNVYILDEDLDKVGSLEGLAPGESIYSTRFVGPRLYMVTFKKVDPLFVIDLSDSQNPAVLGKLKIPGYSDYLQPYDDTHLIGIGKEAIDASESEIGNLNLDFAWYQGVKMALFDVSNVEHPVEMYKVIIGDRGTDSPVLHDHRAFLFDKEKGLLVLPVTIAEIIGTKASDNQYGKTVFDGVYVYDVSLTQGFTLRGNVSHYNTGEVENNVWYYYGGNSIQRSMYIRDVLYTMSPNRLQLNDMVTLDNLKAIELSAPISVAMYDQSSWASGFFQFPSINNTTTTGSS